MRATPINWSYSEQLIKFPPAGPAGRTKLLCEQRRVTIRGYRQKHFIVEIVPGI